MSKDLLILFVRNPILGKVKTRLAATLGPEKAVEIYLRLLSRTHQITLNLPVDKIVYYADFLAENDIWEEAVYKKKIQVGADLGERMRNAFAAGFAEDYHRICLIGSDCYELTPAIIKNAFQELVNRDVIVGPATDGGYYLLGLTALYPDLFQEISWSTSRVLAQTLQAAQKSNLSLGLLPPLTDVDEEKDLETMPPYI